MPRAISTVSSGCALLTALACSSPERDLGRTNDRPPPNAMRSSECDETEQEGKLQAPRAALLSDFAGLWLGDMEDALGDLDRHDGLPVYTFPSGSTRVLLEVLELSEPRHVTATLTFGEGEPPHRAASQLSSPLPAEGLVYSAEPIASAFDLEHTGKHDNYAAELALDGKLVLAFSIDDVSVSELHLRFGSVGLVGIFNGLSLVNERGFLTRPGSVRFQRIHDGRARALPRIPDD